MKATFEITSRFGSETEATAIAPGAGAVLATAAVGFEVTQAGPYLFCALIWT